MDYSTEVRVNALRLAVKMTDWKVGRDDIDQAKRIIEIADIFKRYIVTGE